MTTFRHLAVPALLLLPCQAVLGQEKSASVVSTEIYEGWRQYSVHCARCHGQDAVGNPVTANLLESTADGGPVAEEAGFVKVILEGRPSRGMPAFEGQTTPEQATAIYAYVRARATGKVPAGRPKPSA